jgi:hypothetical protein
MEAARMKFHEQRCRLEAQELEYGVWNAETDRLANETSKAYHAYEQAWCQWFAAANGYAFHGLREHKPTEAFVAAVTKPVLMRHLGEAVADYMMGEFTPIEPT